MNLRKIKSGDTFGDWLVLEDQQIGKLGQQILCRCKCGKEKKVNYWRLLHGIATKCQQCSLQGINKKHGDSQSRLYGIWSTLKRRPKNKQYIHITVFNVWVNSYDSFKKWALTHGYSDNLSIDRIDGTKGYYPDNCRWVTPQIQAENTKLLSSNNTSGYRGVTFDKVTNKWIAYITVKRKRFNLGRYSTKEEAAKVRDTYVVKHGLIHRPLNRSNI